MQVLNEKIVEDIKKVELLIKNNKVDRNEGYMYISILVSEMSNDPSTKTGAVIVNANDEILSYGYNATPEGYENKINWNNRDGWLETKYPYVIHAERRAIYSGFKACKDLSDTSMYATLFPCNECALAIIDSGINHLYYLSDKYHDKEFSEAARRLLDGCNVAYEQMELKNEYIMQKVKKN